MNYLETYATAMQRLAAERPKQSQVINVPPLVDQVRDLLANLPPAQKMRISLPMLLPHLQGKYRDRPHFIQVAKALRQLGYRQMRSWKKSDAGARYWLAPESKEAHRG